MSHYDRQIEAHDEELREKKRLLDLKHMRAILAALEEVNINMTHLRGSEYDPLRRAFAETAIFAEHAKFRLDRG